MKKMLKTMLVLTMVVLMLASSVSAYAAKPMKPSSKTETPAAAAAEVAEAAADGEVVELNWADFEPLLKENELNGDYYTLNAVALQFWVTEVLEQVELSDEDAEDGLIAYFDDGEGKYGFFVTYVDVEGATLEEYAKEVAEDDAYTDLETLKVNGLDAIAYAENDKELDMEFEYVTFATEGGYLLTFTFWDTSDEDYLGMATIMIASIQPEETKA